LLIFEFINNEQQLTLLFKQTKFLKTFFTYFLILFSISAIGQNNLVQNGSFEQIDSCYGDPSPLGFDVFQWSGCTGWSNPTYASSDLWCQNPVFGNNTPPFIPGFGYQYPRTGENMAGIFVLETPFPNYREFIQNELNTSLIKDNIYKISFYLNLSDGNNGTSSIGLFLSSTKINVLTNYNFVFDNTLITLKESSAFIEDTVQWSLVDIYYKAKGNERYLILGSFTDSNNIHLKDSNLNTAWGIYYYIDDVELVQTPYSFNIPNVFSPNGDNMNDVFSPNVVNIEEWKCIIYNRWGQEVYQLNNGISSWDGKTTVGKEVPEGTYYYVFTTIIEDENISEKGFITLLR
jgi:gliding motility-associated-like protein